ncbi:SDR family NAD(P)-dependent oxidoreductase [Aestuariivirga litoralis]|uniref:SDR family NAD(P)-dependent oxidoreductase n=1 Tax=Aestuariivirga litoralis TaxID=2650924 RepID=UPI0018C85DB7|nr:SDR family NAD(P)-dependent oxidoreductase [Aestuariivirga litoralis]MBG1230875.1 SDR family NAD(P)-dependent oxidoreductase [Aestuariivirga litoralis]
MKGRRVLITGAGRGLGAAFAIVLADLGAEVVLSGRDTAKLATVADAIAAHTGTRPECVALDLANHKAISALTASWRHDKRPLDILINNASLWLSGPFDGEDEELLALIGANVSGTMLLTKGLLPLMQQSAHGDLVNIISVSGIGQAAQQNASVAFMASKAAQAGFTDALRQELRGTNVRVTAVYPPNLEDISPLDAAWNTPKDNSAWVNNRDVVDQTLFALQRGRHVSFQSILLEAATANLHFHKD